MIDVDGLPFLPVVLMAVVFCHVILVSFISTAWLFWNAFINQMPVIIMEFLNGIDVLCLFPAFFDLDETVSIYDCHERNRQNDYFKHKAPSFYSQIQISQPKSFRQTAGLAGYYISSESSITVNGPSLVRETFIAAPNSPCATIGTVSWHLKMIYSYRVLARSGFPALIKDGRLP